MNPLREPCDYKEDGIPCGDESEVFGVEGKTAIARCPKHDFMAPWSETTWEEFVLAKVMLS